MKFLVKKNLQELSDQELVEQAALVIQNVLDYGYNAEIAQYMGRIFTEASNRHENRNSPIVKR